MEVIEFNQISTNNQNISDELNIVNQDTKYAKSKRASRILGITIVTITAGSAILLGGSILDYSNAFIKDPTITATAGDSLFSIASTTLTYDFSITNSGNLQVTFMLDSSSENIYTLDVSKDDDYTGEIENLEYGVNYSLYFKVSNGFDYVKKINEVSFVLEQ